MTGDSRGIKRRLRAKELADNELWKLTIAEIEELINVGMIHALDEPKIASIFLELYAVGDRPTVDEMDRYLQQLWPGQSDGMRRHVVGFWKRVLNNPGHRFRCLSGGWPWRRPFTIPDRIVEREDLVPCGDRLVTQVHLAADAYRSALEASPVSEETDAALGRLTWAVRAFTIWGVARDAHPDAPWSGSIFRLGEDDLRPFEQQTKRGRARREHREAEMIERHYREIDEMRVRSGLEPWGTDSR